MNSQKILFVVSKLDYLESHRTPLLDALASLGFELIIATRKRTRNQRLSNSSAQIIDFNISRKGVRSIISETNVLKQIVKQLDPGIVFCVAMKPILIGSLVSLLINKKPHFIMAVNGLGTFANISSTPSLRWIRNEIAVLFLRLLLCQRNFYYIFQNKDNQIRLLGNNNNKFKRSVLVEGVGVKLEANQRTRVRDHRKRPTKFIFAARLLRTKGVEVLLAAARILKEKKANCSIYVAGVFDYENDECIPEQTIIAAHKAKEIFWIGEVRRMNHLLEHMDCFVYPSQYGEGMPKVLIEACAASLPIITTQIPGCRDIVKNGENGLILKRNDAQSLAKCIEECLQNPSQMQIFGKNSRRRFEANYTEELSTAKIVKFIETISNIDSASRSV